MVNSITTGIIQNPYNSYTNGYSGTIGTDTDVENQNGFKRVGEDEDGKKECQTCKNRKYNERDTGDRCYPFSGCLCV